MTCLICRHGETRPGRTTVTLTRGNCTVIFKGVPAEICENCGEYYLPEATTADLLHQADEAARRGAEVEILQYAA